MGVPCAKCSQGSAPLVVQVALAGITNGTCTTCAALNGTYVLAYKTTAAGYAVWELAFPAVCSLFTHVQFKLKCGTVSGPDLSVLVANSAFGRILGWTGTLPAAADCATMNWSVPPDPFLGDSACVHGFSTCLVTPG
jgi:hypothetical protein